MIGALASGLLGALIGALIWRRRSVRVEGRFLPYEGSERSLIASVALYGIGFAAAFIFFLT